MASDIAIRVSGVSKSFKLPHERDGNLKSSIVNIGRHKLGYEQRQVLKDVSFEVKKGEFFGIVGRNGSGKSTLLKLIAGIYTPDKGKVHVAGSLTPFIELGVGFNSDLSGRDNVYLNGAMLGFSSKEMDEMYQEIVDFAELEEFMDQKLKNYSSGMQVRLAFSIAIRANSDVLILDEVLAVGDESFKRKCYKYFSELKRNKKTIILVTHSMEQVNQFCDRALIIEKGEVLDSGNPAEVAEQYKALFADDKTNVKIAKTDNGAYYNDDFDIIPKFKKTDSKLNFDFRIIPKKDFENGVVGMFLQRDSGGTNLWRWASDDPTDVNKNIDIELKKDQPIKIKIELDNILPEGSFIFTVLLRNHDKSQEFARFVNIVKFDHYVDSVYKKYWKMNESIEVIK